MSCNTGDGRETEVGNAGPPVVINQDVRLRRCWGCELGAISFEKDLYPFQISVGYAEVVHVIQTVRNVDQLNSTSVRYLRGGDLTYKFSAVCVLIPCDELVNVSVLHPLRNHRKPVCTYCHSKQW